MSDADYEEHVEEENFNENEEHIEENMEIVDKEQTHEIDHENENENENQDIINNRKRSWVWSYFVLDDILNKARCNLCKMPITTSKGSTTGMSNHLKSKHKIMKNMNNNERQKNQKQLTLQESIQTSVTNVSLILLFYFNYNITN
jgi:BED zinc finger